MSTLYSLSADSKNPPYLTRKTARPVDFHIDGDIGDAFVSKRKMVAEGFADQNHLTYIEVGITNACNLNCTYCGEFENPIYRTSVTEGKKLDKLLRALDDLETLRLLSITGGEPLLSPYYVDNVVVPLLDFANSKGIVTQVNSNLTVPTSLLEKIVGKVSILHTSCNYTSADDFLHIALPGTNDGQRARSLFRLLESNMRFLVQEGVCVTAESIIYTDTFSNIAKINHFLASIGIARQEIQPPFPTKNQAFEVPSLDQLVGSLNDFLDDRAPTLLVQLDCAPFFWCKATGKALALLERLSKEQNFVTRSCPDGRSRLNVNLDGEVRVTDFSGLAPIGSIHEMSLSEIFGKWQETDLYRDFNCQCADRKCLGPCILVANTYYPGWRPGLHK